MLLSFVCVKIQLFVWCRWMRALTDACFVQSAETWQIRLPHVGVKTYIEFNDISSWICLRLINVWECEYVNTAEIISKVTMTLSLINSNKDFDFAGWVIKTPCQFYFLSVKIHYVTSRDHTSFSLGDIRMTSGWCNLFYDGKIVPYQNRCTRIPRLTVSVPDYGS